MGCACGQRECKSCRMRALGKAQAKYVLTPVLEAQLREAYRAGSARELKARLRTLRGARPQWPAWAWTQAAARLGLASQVCERRPYTREEDRMLLEHLGQMTVARLARRLGRSVPSVKRRCASLELSWRVREGFTAAEIAECFGVERHTAARWIQEGRFGPHLIEVGTMTRVREEGVRYFIRRHAEAYDLRRVNSVWFKGFMFGAASWR